MAAGKKWFLYGCLGCLGVVVLVVVIGAVVSGVALMQVRNEQVERKVATQELPATILADATATEQLAIPREAGRVVLNLNRGEFRVEPLPPGESMRVEATYDKKLYRLTESLEQEGSAAWTYTVEFNSSGNSNIMAALRQLFGGSQPEVQVYLPSDVPLGLDISMTQGAGEMTLGGMWLTQVDLFLDQGGFQVDVDEPLLHPAESFSLRGHMGGLQISRLGNASPQRLDIELGMGGLELDLRGKWMNDSDIDIRSTMGGTIVRLPRDVVIEGIDAGAFRAPDESEIPVPTLRFSSSASMGEIEFID